MADHGRVLVVGVGNPLRADDGVGAQVVRGVDGHGATVVEHDGEPAALIELWAATDAVVLVDAGRSGAAPGTVRRFDASERALPARTGRTSTHGLGLGDAIELARALGRLPARVVVVEIEAERFDVGRGLSPAVAAAVPAATAAVARELRSLAR